MRHAAFQAEDLFPDGPLRRLGRRVESLERIDSTNSYLLARAEVFGDGAVVTAQFQTAGRGRFSRRWQAPRGSSILLSILLIEPDGSPLISYATMIAALASVQAVDAETDCRPALSWPNDLVVGAKKLGGVLAESRPLTDPSGRTRRALVIGAGLNCLQQRGHFDGDISETATSLELECPHPIDRTAVARRLFSRLDDLIFNAGRASNGAADLAQAWTKRCGDLGARVMLEECARRYTGTVVEITDNGDLIVQLDDGGRRRFGSATTTRIR